MSDIQKADVTVIVLLYNDMPHGLQAIESVLSQTYSNIKIKIMDNGSTDHTWSEIQKYKSDPRVQLIRNNKNQRSEFAAIEALKTDTEYLSFLFSDDLYSKNRIELGLSKFKENPDLSAVFFNNIFINEKGTVLEKTPVTLFKGDIASFSKSMHLQNFFLRGNSLHPCGMLIKTKKYCELGGFRPYFHRIGDMIFFTKLLSHENVGFFEEKMQKITVWKNGRNESSMNSQVFSKISYESIKFLEEYFFMALSEPNKIIEIFSGKNEPAFVFSEKCEAVWYLGHQALYVNSPVYRFFGMNCLYYAAENGTDILNQKILSLSGMTIPQYLDWIQDMYPTFEAIDGFRASLVQLIRSIPLCRRIFKILKSVLYGGKDFLLNIVNRKSKKQEMENGLNPLSDFE
jgi:glycosyltransferase involved in cell wall biosynthesis